MRNNIPEQKRGCLRLLIFGLVDTSSSTGWNRILWIFSTDFLSEFQKLAKNMMRVLSHSRVPLMASHVLRLLLLSDQRKWCAGYQQTAVCDHNTSSSFRHLYIASFCSFSEECCLFLLSPFQLVCFSFPSSYSAGTFTQAFLGPVRNKTTLYFVFLTSQSSAWTHICLHPWFSLSVLYASLSLQCSSCKTLPSPLASFQ